MRVCAACVVAMCVYSMDVLSRDVHKHNIAIAVHKHVCGGAVMVWYWCDVAYFIFVVVMKKAVLLCEC